MYTRDAVTWWKERKRRSCGRNVGKRCRLCKHHPSETSGVPGSGERMRNLTTTGLGEKRVKQR